MKILVLTKLSEQDNYVLDFMKRLSTRVDISAEILNVVKAPSEIPLQHSGEIISVCYDFDTAPLEAMQEKAGQQLTLIKEQHDFIQATSVKIGDPYRIIQEALKGSTYDMIFMGAHVSTTFEDAFSKTFIEKVKDKTDIPILSLKCDRSEIQFEKIGVFSCFEEIIEADQLRLMSVIQQAFGSEAHFYVTQKEGSITDLDKLKEKVLEFATLNHIKEPKLHLINNSHKVGSEIQNEVIQEGLSLISLVDFKRQSFSWLYNRDLKSQVANHLLAPIIF
ncbi:MAG: universal stress protein [Cyclobacteriaceae bacterium]|nr:universal stress protein [Cyclobacteriaceae bacterium]